MYTAPASYLVQMAFSLPIDFTAEKKTKFVNVIAIVAGLQMADVSASVLTSLPVAISTQSHKTYSVCACAYRCDMGWQPLVGSLTI